MSDAGQSGKTAGQGGKTKDNSQHNDEIRNYIGWEDDYLKGHQEAELKSSNEHKVLERGGAYNPAEKLREEQRRNSDHRLSEIQKSIEAGGLFILTILGIIGISATGLIWILHFLTPDDCFLNFLPSEKIDKIERFLFGAVTSGFVSARYFATRKK